MKPCPSHVSDKVLRDRVRRGLDVEEELPEPVSSVYAVTEAWGEKAFLVHYDRTNEVAWVPEAEVHPGAINGKALVTVSTVESAVAMVEQHRELLAAARQARKRKGAAPRVVSRRRKTAKK